MGSRWIIRSDPDFVPEGNVDFRLTYEGPLRASNVGREKAAHKHSIRRVFHRQLRELWLTHPRLEQLTQPAASYGYNPKRPGPLTRIIAEDNQRCSIGFVPLVRGDMGVTCSLDVLFLRLGKPGTVLRSGDIDNRLKTLFDALSMPEKCDGVAAPTADETPFYVLASDDKLFTSVAVETDALLEPTGKCDPGDEENDARLVITVSVQPIYTAINFLGDLAP